MGDRTARALLTTLACVVLVGCGGAPKTAPPDPPASPTAPSDRAATPRPGHDLDAEAHTATPRSTSDGPVARVDGVSLPRAEFDRRYAERTASRVKKGKTVPAGLARRHREAILKDLVDRAVFENAIAEAQITIDPAIVDAKFADYRKMFPTAEAWQRNLRPPHRTAETIRADIVHDMSIEALLLARYDISVTRAEVEREYAENPRRYAISDEARARHILFEVQPRHDHARSEAVRKRAEAVLTEARKPDADFAQLARVHSAGPTARRGGDLGRVTRGRLVPELEKAVFSMEPGEISAPLRSRFGWHIVEVTDRRRGRQKSLDEVEESIRGRLARQKRQASMVRLLRMLRGSSRIEILIDPATGEPLVSSK